MLNCLHLRISSASWPRKVTAVIISDNASSIMTTGPLLMTTASIFNKANFLVLRTFFARTLDTRSKFRVLNLKGQLKIQFFTVRSSFFIGQ